MLFFRRHSILLLGLLFLQNCFYYSVEGNLLNQPNLLWTYNLKGGGGIRGRNLRKGNAVVADSNTGLVYVTVGDGSLHILNVAQRDAQPVAVAVYEPEEAPGNKFTECRSGVSIVESTNDLGRPVRYLVYAVIDTPVSSGVEVNEDGELDGDTRSEDLTSRILAVNLDGTLRWSIAVDGLVVGTPLPGQNGVAIYFSRNDGNKGFLSVILTTTQTPELTASIAPPDRNGPFGPVSVSARQEELIPSPMNDVVAVAESWGNGYGTDGSIYIVVPSREFEELGGRGNDAYELRRASDLQLSSVVQPVLSDTSLFLAGRGANLVGWTDNRDISRVLEGAGEDVDFRWSVQLDPSPRNASQPFLTTPAISSNGEFLYVPGASSELYCLSSQNGREEWTDTEGSIILAEPKVFERNGDSVLYVVEAFDGRIRQHDADRGDRNWEFSCSDLSGDASCFDSVEAEFSLTESGNVLYYGDVFGRIVALQVADYETISPTIAPTSMPSTMPSSGPSSSLRPSLQPSESPSLVPSNSPSQVPTGPPVTTSPTSPAPSFAPTLAPKIFGPTSPVAPIFDEIDGLEDLPQDGGDEEFEYMAVVIGAGVVGLLAIVGALLLITRTRNKKREETEKLERGVLVLDDVSKDLEDGQGPSVVTTTGNDSMDMEVVGGSPVYSSKSLKPKKKKKKKKPMTPVTPVTLESIEESPEDISNAEEHVVMLLGEDGDESAAKNLDSQFQYVAEIGNESDAESVNEIERGGVGQPKNSTHVELSVGNNKLKPLLGPQEDSDGDSWAMSEDGKEQRAGKSKKSASSSDDRSVASTQEEKKEDLSEEAGSATSPRPNGLDANRLGDMSPLTLSDRSTDSQLFVESPASFDSTGGRRKQQELSPLSPHVFSKEVDEGLPEDEAMDRGARLIAPSLTHQYNSRRRRDDSPDAKMAAPGMHYMSPSKSGGTPDRRFGQSVRSKRDLSKFKTPPGEKKSPSHGLMESSEPKKPSFKRRSKREEYPAVQQQKPQEAPKIEEPVDPWSSFLKDLADAEENFFTPSHAQRASLLKDDDSISAASEDLLPPPPDTLG